MMKKHWPLVIQALNYLFSTEAGLGVYPLLWIPLGKFCSACSCTHNMCFRRRNRPLLTGWHRLIQAPFLLAYLLSAVFQANPAGDLTSNMG